MKSANYIVSYDISDDKRVKKLAKKMEKFAIRIQYSVFYVPNVRQEDLFEVMEVIAETIDSEEDDVRIYTVEKYGIVMGKGINLNEAILLR